MNELVFLKNDRPVTTSIRIAESFHKNHAHVLRDIQNLDCSADFRESNFGLSSYLSEQNKKLPMYYVTRDGFTFLVMGYRGKKAADFKETYIKRFNDMERYIRNHAIEIAQRRTMTDMIRDSGENTRMHGFGYKQYTDLIYKTVTGKTAAQHRKELGLKSGENIKPYMTPEQIEIIGYIEYMISGMVGMGVQYSDIRDIVTQLATKEVYKIQC